MIYLAGAVVGFAILFGYRCEKKFDEHQEHKKTQKKECLAICAPKNLVSYDDDSCTCGSNTTVFKKRKA